MPDEDRLIERRMVEMDEQMRAEALADRIADHTPALAPLAGGLLDSVAAQLAQAERTAAEARAVLHAVLCAPADDAEALADDLATGVREALEVLGRANVPATSFEFPSVPASRAESAVLAVLARAMGGVDYTPQWLLSLARECIAAADTGI